MKVRTPRSAAPRGRGISGTPSTSTPQTVRKRATRTEKNPSPVAKKGRKRARISSSPESVSLNCDPPALHAPEYYPFDFRVGADRCAVLNELLECDPSSTVVDADRLSSLQHELEAMLSHAADFLRQIHGEKVYLETGDYPTADVSQRPCPTFTLRAPRETAVLLEDDEIDLDEQPDSLPQKKDDDDIDVWPAPSFPVRFWTWCKHTFLKPIDTAYMKEFQELFLDPYTPERTAHLFVNEPWKHIHKTEKTPHRKGRGTAKKTPVRRRTLSDKEVKEEAREPVSERDPAHIAPLINNVLKAFLRDYETGGDSAHDGLKQEERDDSEETETNYWNTESKENGINGGAHNSNRIKEEDLVLDSDSVVKEAGGRLIQYLIDTGIVPSSAEGFYKAFKEIDSGIHVSQEGRQNDEPMNEVSIELLHAQHQLKHALETYRKISTDFYGKLKEEYAQQTLTRCLNAADDELIRLGALCYREPPLPRRVANETDMAVLRFALRARHKRASLLYGPKYRGLRWGSPRKPRKRVWQAPRRDFFEEEDVVKRTHAVKRVSGIVRIPVSRDHERPKDDSDAECDWEAEMGSARLLSGRDPNETASEATSDCESDEGPE